MTGAPPGAGAFRAATASGLGSVLGEFPGSVALGIALHAGFAALILVLAVRWAREALAGREAPPPSLPREGSKLS